ncbi:FecR family protein [Sphingobacterium yanglingense]|uniref:FecR family protein n=1 Tax=Sphingobacterium yanglingense TaxID=1437280 RepID=A0A4R6WK37_9SPHI|nr:FecR domain-containing protein [Sphingobacterium yanglingense]TDQ79287.1 FecR family protein [Sphingobacterium yanglingense]
MNNQQQIQVLFRKYLTGDYSPEELDILLDYFQLERDDHTLTARLVEELQSDIAPEKIPAITKLADGIGQRIFEQVHAPRKKSISMLRRIAAAVLLIGFIGSGILYYYNYNSNLKQRELVSKYGDDVMPGSMRATLITDDGSEVSLDQAQTGIRVAQKLQYSDGTPLQISPTKYATLKTPNGGQYRVELADGTVVWLNAASSLRYPLTFDGVQRDVTLTGEAYFEVSHQNGKPFVVHANGQYVKVLGTKFNINDYDGTIPGVTTLLEGKVEIESKATLQKQVLTPGQQAVVSKQSIQIKAVPDVSDFAAWREGYFIRTAVTLSEIIPELERWYDVTFEIGSQPSARAYIALNREAKLSTILDALTLNYGVKFKIEGRRVVVME